MLHWIISSRHLTWIHDRCCSCPIVKNKRASICSKANYIPIALASFVSKIFEKLLYDRITYALTTCSNQFGFKIKHSTDMCIYAFKEAVLKYHSLNSNALEGACASTGLCVDVGSGVMI